MKTMSKTRVYPTPVLLSITTGKLLCKPHEYHAACEFILGHEIMIHHFTDDTLQDKLCATPAKHLSLIHISEPTRPY